MSDEQDNLSELYYERAIQIFINHDKRYDDNDIKEIEKDVRKISKRDFNVNTILTIINTLTTTLTLWNKLSEQDLNGKRITRIMILNNTNSKMKIQDLNEYYGHIKWDDELKSFPWQGDKSKFGFGFESNTLTGAWGAIVLELENKKYLYLASANSWVGAHKVIFSYRDNNKQSAKDFIKSINDGKYNGIKCDYEENTVFSQKLDDLYFYSIFMINNYRIFFQLAISQEQL